MRPGAGHGPTCLSGGGSLEYATLERCAYCLVITQMPQEHAIIPQDVNSAYSKMLVSEQENMATEVASKDLAGMRGAEKDSQTPPAL